jgi:hypothetical protein
MTAIGAEQLAAHITNLQTKLRIEQTEQGQTIVCFGFAVFVFPLACASA